MRESRIVLDFVPSILELVVWQSLVIAHPSAQTRVSESPRRAVERSSLVSWANANPPLESCAKCVTAITALITETEKEFNIEIASRQKSIDAIHSELRESSAMLGEQRRRLEQLLADKKERERRKHKIV